MTEPVRHIFEVAAEQAGQRLDRFLAELDAQPSRVVPDYVPDSLAGPEGAGTQ